MDNASASAWWPANWGTGGMVAGIIAGLLLLALLYIWLRGRRMPGEHVFRASRLSQGNRIFPAQVLITPTSLTHLHPQWIGRMEESIHMAHIASIRIDTNIMFSDVYIETSGGQKPVQCHGHSKRDAVRMKQLIEQFQSAYYKEQSRPAQTPIT